MSVGAGTGGAITSTQQAVDQGSNSFTTGGTLTPTDIQNRASYEAGAVGVSGGVGKQANGQYGVSGIGAGVGEDSGSASSVTTAGISGMAGNASARTGDAQTGIDPIFDREKVQKEIDVQVAITMEFGRQASTAWGEYSNKKLAEATTEEERQCWGPDGACRAGGHGLIGGLTGGLGGAVGGGVASWSAPQLAAWVFASDLPDAAKEVLATGLVTALGAGLGGTAGGAAAFNEVSNNSLPTLIRIGQFAMQAATAGLNAVTAEGVALLNWCVANPRCSIMVPAAVATALAAQKTAEVQPTGNQIPGYTPSPWVNNSTESVIPESLDERGGASTSSPSNGHLNQAQPVAYPFTDALSITTITSSSGTSQVSIVYQNGSTDEVELPSLVDAQGARHILVGDGPGSGGHLWPGQPGKTPFPHDWDADKILGNISDVATDPASTRNSAAGGRTRIEGVREGVRIVVIVESPSRGGRIVTGYPTNLPRNP